MKEFVKKYKILFVVMFIFFLFINLPTILGIITYSSSNEVEVKGIVLSQDTKYHNSSTTKYELVVEYEYEGETFIEYEVVLYEFEDYYQYKDKVIYLYYSENFGAYLYSSFSSKDSQAGSGTIIIFLLFSNFFYIAFFGGIIVVIYNLDKILKIENQILKICLVRMIKMKNQCIINILLTTIKITI